MKIFQLPARELEVAGEILSQACVWDQEIAGPWTELTATAVAVGSLHPGNRCRINRVAVCYAADGLTLTVGE